MESCGKCQVTISKSPAVITKHHDSDVSILMKKTQTEADATHVAEKHITITYHRQRKAPCIHHKDTKQLSGIQKTEQVRFPYRQVSVFQPIAFETSGVFGESTLVFQHNLGSRIASATGDVWECTWLIQRISLAVVRGNAISIAMSCRRSFLPPEWWLFLCLNV